MNYLTIFGFLFLMAFVIGFISPAEAHPHATLELMESHSHIFAEEKFHDNFIIHTFDQVIFSITDFLNNLLS
ncbi:hypothetical protein [Nitrosopumilus piranensis]|uniref:Uncharacterized protein n=1 Tax=Nitrosopumilus piranensis TaxID=1582439 RepID=A0A0C5BTV9_9ARCH|nr:hypothetical protein [Nitrosopumilus piranensis]AJM91609.1 exported protein of unknown function [Nitrosopumilus piranensis]